MAEKVNPLIQVPELRNHQKARAPKETFTRCEKLRRDTKLSKKRRGRDKMINQEKLPTPPPDPIETNVFDKAFAEEKEGKTLRKDYGFPNRPADHRPSGKSYPVSISRTTAAFAVNFAGTEEAFDNLEKLILLMEQVIDLRDQNSKMFKRVRELERIKTLSNADREFENAFMYEEDIVLPEEDVGFAESLLEAILSSGPKISTKESFRSPPVRQRSKSIGIEHPAILMTQNNSFGQSVQSKKRLSVAGASKVSKWTKVKAALKWEKAGNGEKIDPEFMRYFKVPDNNETSTRSGSSLRIADHSGPLSSGTLSSSSSTDEVFKGIYKRPRSAKLSVRTKENVRSEDPSRRSRSLDGDVSIPHSNVFFSHILKDDTSCKKFEKGHSRTPWRKVKNMIDLHRENTRRQLPPGSIRSEDGYSISSLESSEILQELLQFEYRKARVQITPSECSTLHPSKPSSPGSEIADLSSRRLTPTLTITAPLNEELRSISLPPISNLFDSPRERLPSEEFESLKNTSVAIERSKTWQDISSTVKLKTQYSQKRESTNILSRMHRQDLRWHNVEKASLTTTSVPPSPGRISSFFDETDNAESYSASAEDLRIDVSSNVQVELKNNFQPLHDKLGTQFYQKLTEWKKLKSTSPTGHHQSNSSQVHNSTTKCSARDRDSSNTLLFGEELLTPEFKKKLDEWKRLKKRRTDWKIWKAPSKTETKPGGDSSKIHLSEEFSKKMDKWKKIKAARIEDEYEVGGRKCSNFTESIRNNKVWRALDEKEFQPLEKILAKFRAGLEQTIAEEEISEEIAMENPEPGAMIVDIEDVIEETASPMAKLQPHQTPVYCVAASKSTSIAIPLGTVASGHESSPVILFEAGEVHPMSSRVIKNQTRSFHSSNTSVSRESLNEIQTSTKGSIVESESGEVQSTAFNAIRRSRTILRGINNRKFGKCRMTKSGMDRHIGHPGNDEKSLATDELEPRAKKCDTSENKKIDAGMESQNSDSSWLKKDSILIETGRELIFSDFTQREEREQKAELNTIMDACLETSQILEVFSVEDYATAFIVTDISESDLRKTCMNRTPTFGKKVSQKPKVFTTKPKEKSLATIANDLASDTRAFENVCKRSSVDEDDVVITVDRDIRQKKVLKTRRLTDTLVGYEWRPKIPEDIESSALDPTPLRVSAYRETPEAKSIIITESTLNKIVVPTASAEPIAQEQVLDKNSNNERNPADARGICSERKKQESRNVLIETKPIIFSPFRRSSKEKRIDYEKDDNKSENENLSDIEIQLEAPSISSVPELQPPPQAWTDLHRAKPNSKSPCSEEKRIFYFSEQKRPFLPPSPFPSRKEYRKSSPKETAPSIWMMIQRYNQKLEDAESPASSGSGSPIWRSPVTERIVKTQMGKYQEKVRKAIAGSHRQDVYKNASTSLIRDNTTVLTLNSPLAETYRPNKIPKSTSVDFSRNRKLSTALSIKIDGENDSECSNQESEAYLPKKEKPKVNISPALIHKLATLSSAVAQNAGNSPTPLETSGSNSPVLVSQTSNFQEDLYAVESDEFPPPKLRVLRLQGAKEDFLSRGLSCYPHDPSNDSRQDDIVFNSGTESGNSESRPDLIKSSSAGMINVDPHTFEKLASSRGCKSLSRSIKKARDMPSQLSQITNRFRRARLKRAKEKENKMSTVSVLCRQSLLVDIQPERASKSCPTSPSPQREDDDCNRFEKHRRAVRSRNITLLKNEKLKFKS